MKKVLIQTVLAVLFFVLLVIGIVYVKNILIGSQYEQTSLTTFDYPEGKFKMACNSNECTVFEENNAMPIIRIPKEIVIKERLTEPENMKKILLSIY